MASTACKHTPRSAEREEVRRVWERLFAPRWNVGWDDLARVSLVRRYRKREALPVSRNSSKVHFVLSGLACCVFEREPLTFRENRKDTVLTNLFGPGHTILHHFLPYDIDTFHFYAFTDCLVADVEIDDYCTMFLGTTPARLTPLIDELSYPSAFATYRYTHAWIGDQQTRMAAALLELALRFGVREVNGTSILFPLTHEDLSNLIGGHRTSVASLLRGLADAGALKRRGRHFFIHEDRMRLIIKTNSRVGGNGRGSRHPELWKTESVDGNAVPLRITHRQSRQGLR